jgi:hypothetical protein
MDSAFLTVFAIATLAFILLVVFAANRFQRDRKLFFAKGVSVTGYVTSLNTTSRRMKAPGSDHYTTTQTHTVTYEYRVNGETYTRTDGIHGKQFRELTQGGAVEVLYLPEKPTEGRLAVILKAPFMQSGS